MPLQAWRSSHREWVWPCEVTRTTCYTCHTQVHVVPVEYLDTTPATIDYIVSCYILWDSHLFRSSSAMKMFTYTLNLRNLVMT